MTGRRSGTANRWFGRRCALLLSAATVLVAAACSSDGGAAKAPTVTAPKSTTPTRPLVAKGDKYVALGSSFAAGPGIPVQAPTCGRSNHNYPHLVAAALGLVLTDVTCSGATTANLLLGQGKAPPQVNAVTADTKLVTLTVGGNDIDYSASAMTCAAAIADLRCDTKLHEDAIADKVAQLPKALTLTIEAIKLHAPRAKIVIVTYLRVVPVVQRCAELGLPLDGADFISSLGDNLEDALLRAAASQRAYITDAYVASRDHGPCAPVGERWVEGAKPAAGGTPFHPNAKGHRAMAALLRATLGAT